jgi:hypothetical protein
MLGMINGSSHTFGLGKCAPGLGVRTCTQAQILRQVDKTPDNHPDY